MIESEIIELTSIVLDWSEDGSHGIIFVIKVMPNLRYFTWLAPLWSQFWGGEQEGAFASPLHLFLTGNPILLQNSSKWIIQALQRGHAALQREHAAQPQAYHCSP